MITPSQLRPGIAIRYEGQTYKVLLAEYHSGQGKMGGAAHARLQNLETGTLWEHSFRADLRIEDIPVERKTLEFLYESSGDCCFMDPGSFEQLEIPKTIVGERAAFLEAGMRLGIEFIEGRAVSVLFPDILEVRIADTAPPMHAQTDSAFKRAVLGNGIEVMVPQFVKSGDMIRLDLVTMKYMDRAKLDAKSKSA